VAVYDWARAVNGALNSAVAITRIFFVFIGFPCQALKHSNRCGEAQRPGESIEVVVQGTKIVNARSLAR
jgi:hypothetical protein